MRKQPFVLIQDYHFALLPRLIKRRGRTRAWRSSGIFRGRIRKRLAFARGNRSFSTGCWAPISSASTSRRTATIFSKRWIDSVECRIEWERFAVNRGKHFTIVRPHPISVAFPGFRRGNAPPAYRRTQPRGAVQRQFGVGGAFPGRRASIASTTPRASRTVSRHRALSGQVSPIHRGKFTFRAVRRAQPDEHQPLQGFLLRGRGRGRAHQRAVPDRSLEADCVLRAAPRSP